jgi:neurotransmitter:Na+ symporter, NSS family
LARQTFTVLVQDRALLCLNFPTTLPFGELALVFAAWTSLIAMIELATRVLVDGGLPRSRAILMVGAFGFLLGVPSALNQNVFLNQDFVWGVGLMISGFFFAFAVLKYGVRRFREELVNPNAEIHIGVWWEWAIRLVVVQAVVLVGWWFWQVREVPFFGAEGIGSVLVQWAIVLAAFIALNKWMVRRTLERGPVAEEAPAPRVPAGAEGE